MRKNFTKKLLLLISLMCMITCTLMITAFGSVTSDRDINKNETMVSVLDNYPGFETDLVSYFKAKKTGELDVLAYNMADDINSLDLINAVLSKHPELFYVDVNGVTYRSGGGKLKGITVKCTYLEYDKEAFDKEVDKVMKCIDSDMSDFEKILTVHNYLCMDVEYAYDEYVAGAVTDNQHSAIGAIVEKKAVCDGYSKAFSYYMDKLGIDCHVVTGTATNSAGTVNHAWNQVKLDGKWYFVDVSWDDPVPDWYGGVKYTYFLKSAADFADHSWSVSDFEICNSTEYDNSSNVFWRDIYSQMYCIDGNVFYLKVVDKTGVLYSKDLSTNDFKDDGKKIVGIFDKWYAFGSATSYYSGNFSKIAYADGVIYYSNPKEIYAYDIKEKVKKKVLDADVSKGYIYGLKVSNGRLYYQTAQTPNKFDGEVKSCKLSELKSTDVTDKGRIDLKGKKVKLSKSKYAYDGKAKKPTATISGLKKGDDFKVTYSNNKNVGTATVTVTGIGKYKGTLKKTFEIVPKKVVLSKVVSPKKKVIKASWKKVSGTGYQVLVSKNKNFKNSMRFTVKGSGKLNIIVNKKLSSGKKYYVKVRAYKIVKGKRYEGAYSRVLSKVAK